MHHANDLQVVPVWPRPRSSQAPSSIVLELQPAELSLQGGTRLVQALLVQQPAPECVALQLS